MSTISLQSTSWSSSAGGGGGGEILELLELSYGEGKVGMLGWMKGSRKGIKNWLKTVQCEDKSGILRQRNLRR